jgi:hypothetical protein
VSRLGGDQPRERVYSELRMERGTWTDERLNDRFDQFDRRFDRVDSDMRELRAEISNLRQLMLQMAIGMTVGFISVLAAVLAQG